MKETSRRAAEEESLSWTVRHTIDVVYTEQTNKITVYTNYGDNITTCRL